MTQTRHTFWVPVTLNNRITIPEVICTLADIDDQKIVKCTIEAVKPKDPC